MPGARPGALMKAGGCCWTVASVGCFQQGWIPTSNLALSFSYLQYCANLMFAFICLEDYHARTRALKSNWRVNYYISTHFLPANATGCLVPRRWQGSSHPPFALAELLTKFQVLPLKFNSARETYRQQVWDRFCIYPHYCHYVRLTQCLTPLPPEEGGSATNFEINLKVGPLDTQIFTDLGHRALSTRPPTCLLNSHGIFHLQHWWFFLG